MGLGADIGGSIRTPCANTGTTGIKPTAERLSGKGHTLHSESFDGQNSIKKAIGPIGKYVDDSVLMMQAFLNNDYHHSLPVSEQDLYHVNKPWNQEIYTSTQKKRIAYFKSLPIFPPASCAQRAGKY